MKEPFDVMKKVPLEKYFVEFLVPLLRKGKLKDSKKIDGYHSLREYLGLVVLSYFLSELNKDKYVPAINNVNNDDGVICNLTTMEFHPVEQTYVYEGKWDNNVIAGIIDGLKRKTKGDRYSKGSWLLVLNNANGELQLEAVKEHIINTGFTSVIFFGPEGNEEFKYNICLVKDGEKITNEIYTLTIDPLNGKAKLL